MLNDGVLYYPDSDRLQRMQDDSSLNSPGRKLQRSQSSITDSFRMAASVLQGGSGPSRRAQNLVVHNIRIKDKQDYKKQPECQVCFIEFGRFGQHHCRICANAVCSSCSFSTINKERACDKCAYHYSDSEREVFKEEAIRLLTSLCVEYLAVKMRTEEELKSLEMQIPREEEKGKERKGVQEKMKRQNEKLQQLVRDRKRLQEELQRIKNS